MRASHSLHKISGDNNFYYLTGSLVALLVIFALGQGQSDPLINTILQFVVLLPIAVCFLSLRYDTIWFRFLIALVVGWTLVIVFHRLLDVKWLSVLSLLLMLVFFMGTFRAIVRQVLFSEGVDNNKIIGSVAQFLLLGLMWTTVYLLILEFSPHAFTGLTHEPWAENFSRVAYFSFVTLTTLGYGDISPKLPLAQVVVYLEAMTGIFYMAIVVASLISARPVRLYKEK